MSSLNILISNCLYVNGWYDYSVPISETYFKMSRPVHVISFFCHLPLVPVHYTPYHLVVIAKRQKMKVCAIQETKMLII